MVPQPLTPAELLPLTNIDGAVLLDPSGTCHAVGVIPDGVAKGRGDPARGARYNSAVRYMASHPPPTVIIIVSEDGMIDILPKLKPQITRSRREKAVDAVLRAAAVPEVNFEVFHQAWTQLEYLAFYLTTEQCDQANAAHRDVEEARWQRNHTRIEFTPLKPKPDMDDSYLLSG